MPAGQMGVRPRHLADERRVLLQHAVGRVAPADPQLVLLFLAPLDRSAAAAHLDVQIVLVAGADLAHRKTPARAVVKAQEDGRQIFHRDVHRRGRGVRRGLKRFGPRRLPARLDRRRHIRQHLGDAQAGDVFSQVAPVGAHVAERGGGPALVGLEAPRIVRVEQEPVLQIGAVHEVRTADLAAGDEVARLLHERIAPVIERDGVDDARGPRAVEQIARLGARHGQRLVGNDVLAGGNRRSVHARVQVIRRRVVHHMDVRIGDERIERPIGLRCAERGGLGARRMPRSTRPRPRCPRSRAV